MTKKPAKPQVAQFEVPPGSSPGQIASEAAHHYAQIKAAQAERAAPKPLHVKVTEQQLARAKTALESRLVMHIANAADMGDVGLISKTVADLRALDLVEPCRPAVAPGTVRPVSAAVAEQRAAADDVVKMQAYAAKVARREAVEAERAEAPGSED